MESTTTMKGTGTCTQKLDVTEVFPKDGLSKDKKKKRSIQLHSDSSTEHILYYGLIVIFKDF